MVEAVAALVAVVDTQDDALEVWVHGLVLVAFADMAGSLVAVVMVEAEMLVVV